MRSDDDVPPSRKAGTAKPRLAVNDTAWRKPLKGARRRDSFERPLLHLGINMTRAVGNAEVDGSSILGLVPACGEVADLIHQVERLRARLEQIFVPFTRAS